MFTKFGRISSTIKPSILHCYYRELTSDSTAAINATEEEVDKKVKQMLEMEPEDPQTLTKLAEVTNEESKTKFDMFWSECSKFLSEDVRLAIDDRRHTSVTHLAKAIYQSVIFWSRCRCSVHLIVPFLALSGCDYSSG